MSRHIGTLVQFFAFGVGLATAAVSMAFVVRLNAQSAPPAVHVCAGSDRVLREAAGGGCGPGERPLRIMLASASPEAPKHSPVPPTPTKAAGVHYRVTAPFEVVDDNGVAIMRVVSGYHNDGTRGMQIFDTQGRQVAVVNSALDGGFVKVMRNGAGEETATISATREGPMVLVRDGGVPRAVLGRTPGGRMAAWINSASGRQLAAIGESPELKDAGAIRLYNSDGSAAVSADASAAGGMVNVFAKTRKLPVAAMTTEKDGRGVLSVYNVSGTAAAALTESNAVANTGRIYVNDPRGAWVFAAGLTHSGGTACVHQKAGIKCLGIGLPGF